MPRAIDRFLALVREVAEGTTARSENELSRRFGDVLEGLGLHTVVDTGQSGGKRPDVLAYRSALDATLALPAEVVVEAKQPSEVSAYPTLAVATARGLWATKTVPYIVQNLPRIRYFIVTSFTDFAFLRISDEIRAAFASKDRASLEADVALQTKVEEEIRLFSLASAEKVKAATAAWSAWIKLHLEVDRFKDVPLSKVANTVRVEDEDDLEAFTLRLVDLAAGKTDTAGVPLAQEGVFGAVRAALPPRYKDLDGETKRDLHLFVMSQNPAVTMAAVRKIVEEDSGRWLDDFVAASIHSLVSRLFALSVIEGLYCLGEKNPLIEKNLWVINTSAYDKLSDDRLLVVVTNAIRRLKDSRNNVVKRLAVFGAFFDWIGRYIDPALFRPLFELFVSHDFRSLRADLLGRFFEIYAQQINATRRKSLGQYYTPVPVVRFMWHIVRQALAERSIQLDRVTALDPATGSATFLKEGASLFGAADVPQFWDRLVGFDISPQVMGIAQTNLYMAILANVEQTDALKVGDLRLYTTDALDPRNGRYLKDVQPLFDDATHREFLQRVVEVSANIKRKEHFSVVVGNPPYKNNSLLTLAEVAQRFPTLLTTSSEASMAQTRNIRDDYCWFFAAADAYSNDEGLICFITSDSYTRKPSYRLFREELLRRYRVLRLFRLGEGIFRDVSHRMAFAIILLEKRDQPLESVDDADAYPYYDVRPLIAGVGDVVGTKSDPRFVRMGIAVERGDELVPPVEHKPVRAHDFLMFPVAEGIVGRVLSDGVPVSLRKGDRIFQTKWPGIITAADVLLKAKERDDLHVQVSTFIDAAHGSKTPAKRRSAIEEWADDRRITGADNVDRLVEIADFISAHRLTYDRSKIKPSFSGSIPNDLRWYPPPEYRHFIYYEPAIHIERKKHEGKDKGWGYMGQWREPQSHHIRPKLVFTTSTNPKSGFKAFVLDDEWYVKLHGGTSQQYHYTGLINPLEPARMGRAENNLAGSGERACEIFARAGASSTEFLHFIAGIYNSALAEEFLREESGDDLHIRLPTRVNAALCITIAMTSRRLRDLHHLLYDGPESGAVAASSIETMAPAELLRDIGLTSVATGGGRFKSGREYRLPVNFRDDVRALIAGEQDAINDLVADLYA